MNKQVWDYESFKLIGGGTNNFEEVLKMEFIYPYMSLLTIDSSSSLIFWSIENVNAFQFLKQIIKINLCSPNEK